MKIPFHVPSITNIEVDAVVSVLRSGWLTSGAIAEQFESEFSEFYGRESIAVSSASTGLQLTYEALAMRDTREVVVPSLTFTSSAMGALHAGLRCKVADVSEDTLCLDHEQLPELISRRSTAVCAVHYAGYCASELRSVLGKLAESGVSVVEDAAHALPARDSLGEVGSGGVSSATIFSFYANKTVTAGEGGMVTVADVDLARDIRLLRQHGIDRTTYFRRFGSAESTWDYNVSLPGHKANLPDVLAALGLAQFRRRQEMHRARVEIAKRYLELLKNSEYLLPPFGEDPETHAWHLFVVRVPAGVDRDKVMTHLLASGIGCSLHYRPLHRHSFYSRYLDLDPRDYPVSESVFQTAISLPIYPGLGNDAVEETVAALNDGLKLGGM